MRGDHPHLERDTELGEDVDRGPHDGEVGVASHDHTDERGGHVVQASVTAVTVALPTVTAEPELATATGEIVRTRLTDALQIEHPVMLAGMGGVSYHTLVAAVSEAGGFGCLGASAMTQDEMVDEIRAVKAATSKPFGVDLLTALPEQMMSNIELVIREGAQVFVAGLGVPRDAIKLCHDNNVLVVNMCGKVRHAVAAVEAGCDLVVAQGTEAGGHTGTVATMPLVPQIVDAVGDRVPVVAAGGLFDGRGLAASLALGADGVWIGTRFIATPEARSTPGYKEALVRAAEDDTVISRAFTGKTLRAVRNKTTQYYDEHPEEVRPFPEQIFKAVEEGTLHLTGGDEAAGVDPDRECYPAGQGTGAIDALVPAGELVRQFVTEAEAVIESLGGLRAQAPA
jgi:enoyl-[acyl-carrier protein] reductase II